MVKSKATTLYIKNGNDDTAIANIAVDKTSWTEEIDISGCNYLKFHQYTLIVQWLYYIFTE